MKIKALISDLGGVLVRTEAGQPRQDLAGRLGLSRAELEALVFSGTFGTRAQLGQISEAELWDSVASALGLPPEEVPDLARQFWGGDRLDAGLVEFIRGLRPRLVTGLLSNAFDGLRHQLEKVWTISDAFDVMIISAEEGIMKPAPEIYRLAAARLGVPPEEAVFLDDFEENVRGAQAVGMHAVHFRNPAQALDELHSYIQGPQPATWEAEFEGR